MLFAFASSLLLLLADQVESMPQIGRVIPNRPTDYFLMEHHNYLARKSARRAHAVMNHESYHQRNIIRVSPSQSSAAPAITLPAASPAAKAGASSNDWKRETAAACMMSLAALNGQASNPTGLAACYNIQSFNSSTGVFEADLQLYRIAAATGNWASLMTQAVNVGMSYSDATIAPSNANRKREEEPPSTTKAGSDNVGSPKFRRVAAAPAMVQEMSFVGKLNGNVMGQVNDTAKLHTFLIPSIALSGTEKSGKLITTELSSNEASFVNGIFANQTKTSTSTGAAASSAAEEAATFVLPGQTLGIFPTGLIITSSWTLLFVLTVGYGTIERFRFREAYRRRVKYRQALNAKPIARF
ncbi:MAG: hypothetical protein L6R36_007867 [Xanthoria steineri]|nr:MAG: hypothetical protein L6R36_007867 [Xanthoria steineri]